MKYIRTKYNTIADVSHLGIEGLLKDRLGEHEEFSAATKNGWLAYLYADEIVKEADSIEELCDEFVIKGTRGLYLGIPLKECELRNIPITQIYGAVWTDKGLIYVAKLNEKGKFELL